MAAFADLVRFIPLAGGLGDFAFSSAVAGCQSPALAGVQNGVKYKCVAVSVDLSQWELFEGAYNLGALTFPRTTVLYNSSGTGTASGQSGAGTKINFATVPQVAVVALAEDLISPDTANAFSATQQLRIANNILVPSGAGAQTLTGPQQLQVLANLGLGPPIGVPDGGTGAATLTNHGILVGAGAATVTQLPAAPVGTVLIGNGAAADPSFSPTLQLGSTGVAQGSSILVGLASGAVTDTVQAAAGTYNFNRPTSAGIAGQPLVSGGGALAPMTWGLTSFTNAIGADVNLNNTANFFNGPSVAQGTVGTWLVIGQITFTDSAATAVFVAKLWDGTTVIAGGGATGNSTNAVNTATVSGIITNPAGNIRIDGKDLSNTTGKMLAAVGGLAGATSITAVRIA